MVAVDLGQFVLVAVTEGKPYNRAVGAVGLFSFVR